MKKLSLPLILASVTFAATLSFAEQETDNVVFPAKGSSPAFSISKSETKFDVSNQDWLYPGWSGSLQAGVDDSGNQGASISLYLERDGLVICSSTENQADNVITGIKQCNGRMTPIGFHIPPKEIFQGESWVVHFGKLIVNAVPLALSPLSLGVVAPLAATIQNVVPLDPAQVYRAGRQMGKSSARSGTSAETPSRRTTA